MGVLEIIGALCLFIGCVFALTGSIGVLRMPDFYSRLHPAGKSDTLAQGMILLGLALFAGQQLIYTLGSEHGGEHGSEWIGIANIILKLILLSALLFLTAPTSTHAISKAARLDRHTKIAVDHDPSSSRVAEIFVAGDVREPLAEEVGPVLDVHEPDLDPDLDPDPDSSGDTQSEDD